MSSANGLFDSLKEKAETMINKASRRLSHHGSKGEEAAKQASGSAQNAGQNVADSAADATNSAEQAARKGLNNPTQPPQ
ncbi:hypothetical protein LPJ78_002442 [Coemansia sp. RSA 989]|nr:hypothetical protein LPJ68_004036 [Coemansia sp. RSA 1086]KAJ1748569.1 hypothetical protein LPJ79_004409 [Coemansia sp. RSA 1821]KAJ1865754.1 hypothetical protein LPJ78_002442 [Coemansia sp. RSA 989]KAJ1873675.1 hypothetical protein LPJ55_002126 [Coemansia sp. RSA 990]KAJ2627024.1 hypothetical protein H4R22_004582 [Coemansia sp. RSA 1290]KAJ2648810.1 hypothetical protein IWW40_003610 [Coemansia sp. RSA 1250]KAJ2671418.1 hypothetical protein IWW42_003377 [Coemansia sp. RSA 1085]